MTGPAWDAPLTDEAIAGIAAGFADHEPVRRDGLVLADHVLCHVCHRAELTGSRSVA